MKLGRIFWSTVCATPSWFLWWWPPPEASPTWIYVTVVLLGSACLTWIKQIQCTKLFTESQWWQWCQCVVTSIWLTAGCKEKAGIIHWGVSRYTKTMCCKVDASLPTQKYSPKTICGLNVNISLNSFHTRVTWVTFQLQLAWTPMGTDPSEGHLLSANWLWRSLTYNFLLFLSIIYHLLSVSTHPSISISNSCFPHSTLRWFWRFSGNQVGRLEKRNHQSSFHAALVFRMPGISSWQPGRDSADPTISSPSSPGPWKSRSGTGKKGTKKQFP